VLSLLDAEELRVIASHDVEVGSHGFSHRPLPALTEAELADEIAGSAQTLAAQEIPLPRVFSYPHGAWTPAVATGVAEAGYALAFTVQPGVVRPESPRYALPRIEVLRQDTPRRLAVKMREARKARR
jgi:peptidoglycan/xylan/chitin deacetylase (PgdA/CDA1 family)